jgi:phosphoribosyl-dephospho-CoA transferase
MDRLPRVHDMILLRSRSMVPSDREHPSWPAPTLGGAPWVVVRRGRSSKETIAIGVRGVARHERWAGYVDTAQVLMRKGPEQLRSQLIAGSRRGIPAFQGLTFLEEQLNRMDLEWGPGGSVGFELASGEATVTDRSDLDLVLFAPEPFGRMAALRLWKEISTSPCKVDVLVEAPYCGFSLEEYAAGRSDKLLLRTESGRMLGNDPWLDRDPRCV